MKLPGLIFTAFVAMEFVSGQENYLTGWSQHQTLWLNTQGNGANVPAAVLKFPVLVRLDSSNFNAGFAQASAGGADLRFTKADNATRLPHQVESWNVAGKTAEVWVLADTVLGNNGTQTLRMHWGNAGASDSSRGPSVFDTAAGFQAVWHFGEGNNDTAFDATANRFHGSPQRTSSTSYAFPEDTVGVIGRARRFGSGPSASGTSNSAGNYFVVPNSASGRLDFPMNGNYTLSTWVIVNATGTSRTLFSKSDRQYAMEFRNSGTNWEFTEHNLPLGGWQVVSTTGQAATWTHLAGVRDGATSRLYVNGAVVDTMPHTDATTTARVTTQDFNIGRSPDGGTSNAARYYWRGLLDEVRLASVSRSAAWARLEYENQKRNQTLVSFTQPPTSIGSRPGASLTGPEFNVKALGSGLRFEARGQAERMAVSILDVRGRVVWRGLAVMQSNVGSLAWNGRGATGEGLPSGLYLARLTLLDARGGITSSAQRKLRFIR